MDRGTTTKSRQKGGLGVQKCRKVNIALLGKHVLHLVFEAQVTSLERIDESER